MPIGLQDVFTGTVPGDKTGTPGRTCFEIMNANSAVIETAIEDAERKAFVVALGGKNTVVAVEDAVESVPMPYAFVLVEVRAFVSTEQSGSDIVFDIKENGVSILDSNLLVIPAGSNTSVGFSPQPDVLYTILEDNSIISFDIVDTGSGPTAKGAKVTLIGYVIWTTF